MTFLDSEFSFFVKQITFAHDKEQERHGGGGNSMNEINAILAARATD
jgi:hypothetical protein